MFVNGVAVVLSGDEALLKGMSISWITQVEANYVVFSAAKDASATRQLLSHRRFSINVLGEDQKELAARYGGDGFREAVGAEDVEIDWVRPNMPTLKMCCTSLVCELHSVEEVGDQAVIIAHILETQDKSDAKPLIYDKSDYVGDEAV